MNGTQGSPSAPLPEDIKNAIEVAQNQVTLLNAEAIRLSRLKKGEENAIASLLANQAGIKNENAVLVAKNAEWTNCNVLLESKNKELAVENKEKEAKRDVLASEMTILGGKIDALKDTYATTTVDITNAVGKRDGLIAENLEKSQKLRSFIDSVVALHNAL